MSESFYKYLIDDILAKFFAKNPAKEGEHYCLVIESEENRIGIINGFKNSTHSRELTVEGIYEGRIENPELDQYETIQFDADDEGASVPFIIADIDTGGEYLPTIRNAVNKGKKYDKYATLFILSNYATVDTLSTASINLQDKGQPFNAHEIKNCIDACISDTVIISNYEKEYLKAALNRIVEMIDSEGCDMFDFEDVLSILQEGSMNGAFNRLKYFPDNKIYGLLEVPELEKRVYHNQDLFEKVNSIMINLDEDSRETLLSKFLDDKMVNRIISNPSSWKEIDVDDVIESVNRKNANANLSIEKMSFFDMFNHNIESQCVIKENGTAKKQKIQVIVCSEDANVKVKIVFNNSIKDIVSEGFNGTKGEKSLTFILDDKVKSFSVGKEDNKHNFIFTKIAVQRSAFAEIEPNMKIGVADTITVMVPEDVDELHFGSGNIVLTPGSQEIWKDNYQMRFHTKDASNSEINQILTFNDKKVKFKFKFDNVQIVPKSALELFELVWSKKMSFKDARVIPNCGYTYSVVTNGEVEYSTYKDNQFRDLLLLEQKMVDEKAIYLCNTLEGETFNHPLNKKLRETIDAIFNYYQKAGSVPTLTYIDETLASLYKNYLREVKDIILHISTNRYLTKEEWAITKLGVVDFEDGTIWLSPFHPMNVAFMLEFRKHYNEQSCPSNVLKLVGPYYLIPFITSNNIKLCPKLNFFTDELKTWICYEPIEGHEQNHSYNIATKMVQDKLNAFIKQFDFLFMNKECPIIINTFGITDDTNIIKGIVLFIIEQYAKDKESKVQRLEVHEYVSELLVESFYEKLNRLGTDDLITTEFYKIGVKLDNNTNYSVREIIHQIFSRVTFYKHGLKSTSDYSEIGYCHVAFYQMEVENKIRRPNTNELRSELSFNGLISIPSTFNTGKDYVIGFGTKDVNDRTSIVFDIAKAMNELYANEEQEGCAHQYQKNCCVAKAIQFEQDELLNEIYEKANWVTFLNPEVDLDFFYKQNLYIVHYTDQYTINAKYDSITVTKHVDRYKSLLHNSFPQTISASINVDLFTTNMLNYFNCMNGRWLLDVSNKTEFQVREKISIVAAVIAITRFLKRNEDIIWIPISLDEILRVSGSIGLPKDYLFTAKSLKSAGQPLSDDLLMLGLSVVNGRVKLYFYPVEVKASKDDVHAKKGEIQVANTYKLLRERLFGESTFVKQIYRTFFASQLLTNAEKLKANQLISESNFELIDKCRYDLLNARYDIVDDGLPIQEMGLASLIAFNSAQNKIGTEVIDEIPICHININNVEYLKIIDGSAFENEDSFLYSELSASDGYLQTIQLLSERKSKDDTINEKDKIHFSETGGAFHPENKAIKDDLKMDTIDIIEESYEKNALTETINFKGVTLLIGEHKYNHSKIFFYPNNTSLVSHPNLGIIGTMGTGKTQFARSIIAQFSRESCHNVDQTPIGMLVFDYKGDYNDSEFLNKVKGECFNANFPFNPLKLIITDQVKVLNLPAITAGRIADSMTKSFGLGEVQSITIKDAIIEAYEDAGITKDPSTWDRPVPTMQKVVDKYLQEHDAKDKVYMIFRTLEDYPMFTNDSEHCVSLFEWLNAVKVIDLTLYDDSVKKLIVSLILDLFYAEMKQLKGSKQKNGFRELRAMILVDEAHQFMKMKFNSLRRIISEGRMFGVGMILSTQNLSDFKADENYSTFIKSWIVHNVNNPTRSELAAIFGNTDPNLDNYLNYINKAVVFDSICKIGNFVVQMQDTPYFRLVKEDPRFDE